jgi:DNA-binding transcriptional LysR family regulator
MDRLLQIETFIAAIEHASFSKAARELKVTPAMIGRRVDALEKRLRLKLLHRSTRHLTLTEDGRQYVQQCRRILAELNKMEDGVINRHNNVSGRLIVSAPASFGSKHVAVHASGFLKKHPHVEISFNLTDQLVTLTRDRYDLAIRVGRVTEPNCVAVRLASGRRVVSGSPAYFARFGIPQTPSDLARHKCLAFNMNGERRPWQFMHKGRTINVQVDGPLDCNDGNLLHQWTLEGLGLQWRSLWEISDDLAAGRLMIALDDFVSPESDIMAVYPVNKYVPERVRQFINHLRAIYRQKSYWMPRSS